MVASYRDQFVDFLRSFSLVVVVMWHWVFTILVVSPERVSPANLIGFTRGLWVATWVLQVMPVFFFVGGYTHHRSFRHYTPGTSRRFLKRRMGRLLGPAIGLVAVWMVIGWLLEVTLDPAWVWSAVILVLSPLWFLVVYVVMVLIAPIAIRAHRRWGEIAAVWLLGLAGVLDVLRFAHGQGWAAWVNFLVIWGLAHQLGFFYERLVAAPPRTGWMMFWAGLFGLIALTNMGFYPRSLVGVPGESFSNVGPPTLAIVALTLLQVGLVLVIRPKVLIWLKRVSVKRVVGWINEHAMPLYLFHSTGMAVVVAILFGFGYVPPAEPTLHWWLTRPIWLIGPAIATWPLLVLYRVTKRAKTTATPKTAG